MKDNATTKKPNKKRITLVVIAMLAIAVALLAASCSSSVPEEGEYVNTLTAEANDNDDNEASETSKPTQEDQGELGATQEISSDDVSSEPNKNAARAGMQASASQRSSTTQASTEVPSENTPQKHWVEDTEQVWVEDKAAWSEQVPVYGSKEVSICNICGADVTGNASAHGKAHMLAGEGSGHHSEAKQVITGYNTVNHSAEGHYETRVVGGHWE